MLNRDGEQLVAVGSIGGLGQGEQIYAVRYVGALAYVVTFRQTDPLFAVDLTDPANPVLAGELHINGYSSYLHPVGDGLLLGIGQEADDSGRVLGLQVALFDVSDPANPTRLQQLVLGQGSSNAEYDPHAFLWWEKTGTAVLPVQTYGMEVIIDDGSGGGVAGSEPGSGGTADSGSPATTETTIPPDAPTTTVVEPSPPVPIDPSVPTPDAGFIGAIAVHVDPSAVNEVGRVSHAGHARPSGARTPPPSSGRW